MYKSPNNATEYWSIINIYWEDIFHMLNLYLPTHMKQWIDGTSLNISLGDYIIELKENKNPRLVRALNAALWNCPEENSGEWAHKSWNVLHNLCLEEYVLFEEKELNGSLEE